MALDPRSGFGPFLLVLTLLGGTAAEAQEPGVGTIEFPPPPVETIVQRSEQVHPGQDHSSRLIFTIRDQDGGERKEILRRYWKSYNGKDGLEYKLIVFNEYPPDKKGNVFLEWAYRRGSDKKPVRKFYLKFLDAVNNVPETSSDDGFASSDLKPSEMAPRPVFLDSHALLDEEVIAGREYYVVESTPKNPDPSFPYSKVKKWITKDNFLKERIEYYDPKGELLKEQTISWKKSKGVWVWEKVVTTNVQTGRQTFLTIKDIQVNTGLPEDLFTERAMRRGFEKAP